MKRRKVLCRLLAGMMLLGCLTFVPKTGTTAEAAEVSYTRPALAIKNLPGVYKAVAVEDDEKGTATIGIPSIAKQKLADHPTTESPAIITGAAVNYETKTGPTEYTPIEGAELVAPYSYFRWSVIEEQTQGEAGTTGTHKKLSGFDGSYYIIRVDLSQLLEGIDDPDGKYLHVKQENNKALMVASGIENTTFSDALGTKTGSYSLANDFAALKDTTGDDRNTPYFDVILISSAKLVAGADEGKADAPVSDVSLSFYVDETEDYNPGLTYDPQSQDQNHVANVLKKFFDDEKAADGEAKSSYLVKGSDLEIDCMVDETEVDGDQPEFWSLTKAIAYQPYDSHTVRLICEVPVLEGLKIESTSDAMRSVVLDVNSFDIQIANNSKDNSAGLTISKNAELLIKDGAKTAGAELAIGNNATMVIEDGGTMIVDESCTLEVEYDAATITGGETAPADPLMNGQIIVKGGGTLVNHGVINIEGTEAKPLQPNAEEQAAAETVTTDMKSASMTVEGNGLLKNYGCLSIKGKLYVLGKLDNLGRYDDLILANDPDKGEVAYHKGIQITWKDVVTTEGVKPGELIIGGEADGAIYADAVLYNDGDIVIAPGDLYNFGSIELDKGRIYLVDVTEAVIPITPTAEAPTVVEKRVTLEKPRYGLIHSVDVASIKSSDNARVIGATVEVLSNGRLGALTETGRAKLTPDMVRSTDNVNFIRSGSRGYNVDILDLKDGAIDFSNLFLNTFGGKMNMEICIGFRYMTVLVIGKKDETTRRKEPEPTFAPVGMDIPGAASSFDGNGSWHKNSKGWWYGTSATNYASHDWFLIDGKWYFFDHNGYMEEDAYRCNMYLTKDGAWDGKDPVKGWSESAKGLAYTVGAKALRNTWKKIGGDWYYFKSTGYAAKNEFVKGWWISADNIQTDPVRCSWHKDKNGWWYGGGKWYAKNATYTIDGVKYRFDAKGYCTNP